MSSADAFRPGPDGGILSRKGAKSLARSVWRGLDYLATMAGRERAYGGKAGLTLPQRVALWRRGFLSEAGPIYGVRDSAGLHDYLSDFARFSRTGDINRPLEAVLGNKLCFWGVMRSLTDKVAPVSGLVQRGRLVRLGGVGTEPVGAGLRALAATPGTRFVLKPCVDGSGGSGVVVYEWRDGGHRLDAEPVTEEELPRRLGGQFVYLVCPYVGQAGYAGRIFPDVANTIRILTMYDDEADEAFVAGAVHRFGTRGLGAAAVDNWGRGGLSAEIDLASGRMGSAYGFPFGGELRAYPAHPDTGAAIEGVTVPGWPRVRDGVRDLAGRLPFLPYVGWDVVVTGDDGCYAIIEGNRRPDVNLMQVHRPLLADGRARRFYERHGVVRR